MKITKSEFTEKLGKKNLVITIMGMSNIGKTHWSKKLKNLNFEHKCCDDLIENILEPELKSLGYKGLADMAKWLGQPYSPQFQNNQKRYMQHEIEVMEKIFNDLENKHSQNITIDTTGSVIYTGDDICNELKSKSLIIHIEATPEMREQMFNRFLSNPKPIVWGESFKQNDNESDFDALKRCYPKLLDYRTNKYRQFADITIPYQQLIHNSSAENFLETIKNYL